MKTAIVIALIVATVALAWEGEDPPELEGALRTGIYSISNIVVRDTPSSKQNGDAWDPFGGLPDLYITVHTSDGSSTENQGSTRAIENAGSTASWSSLSPIAICGPEQFSGPETLTLIFKVWDSDTYDPDYMDTGEISTSELTTDGENTVYCNYGSEITFELEWLGMQ